jgi:hypothetical protein
VIQCLSMAYQSHHCSSTLPCSACISVFLLAFFFELSILLLCLCMHTQLPLLSLRYRFLFSALCLFCAFWLLPTTCYFPCEITLNRSNLHFFVLRIFIMPIPLLDHTANSLSPLVVTLSLFFIHGHYAEIP